MISILAQERLLGAALGSVFAGVVVFEQRKSLHRSISENYPPTTQSPVRKPVLAKKSGPEFSHLWNRAIDQTFGPVIQAFSSRGW
ncbi:uncharacterized protein LOC120068841 [Benincasa hispida]|uniref:uncharacterized protein LOC120068841 n=1 Tax=Benincasa hispida TaxID=102211 RepID=UPI001900F4FA|nr:uncharacterized protein LOC120068841 [Benincasa hispida]